MAITTDLASPVPYTAGEELELKITFEAPEDGSYYLLGALYDSNFRYISGSMFGIILPVGATCAFNVVSQTQLWVMAAGGIQVLDTKLTLGRSSVILGIFFMKLVNTDISLTDDTEIGSVSLTLVGEAVTGLDLGMIVGAMVVVGMMGIMTKVARIGE